MPVRLALNLTYAMATEHMDAKQRREFDDQLHGWDEQNERATHALWRGDHTSGGES